MQFLFDKLTARPVPATVSETERLRDAVLLQLDWIVGSREWLAESRGTGLIDISMPDPLSLPAGGAPLQRYAERLRRLIDLHEPRLGQVKVELASTRKPDHPFFVVVSGMLVTTEEGLPLRFERLAGGR